jgi:hypothetical protein
MKITKASNKCLELIEQFEHQKALLSLRNKE